MSEWLVVAPLSDIPVLGARVVKTPDLTVAIFRSSTDQIFAIKDECPHKKGPLSQGIMHGTAVTCPLHGWKIDLASGQAMGADTGCANVFQTKVENNLIYLRLTE